MTKKVSKRNSHFLLCLEMEGWLFGKLLFHLKKNMRLSMILNNYQKEQSMNKNNLELTHLEKDI